MGKNIKLIVIFCNERFQTIASSDFTADNVAKGVQNQKFLRMKESFKVLDEYLRNEIKQQDKMIICSAGLGNVIEKKFEQEKISLENKFIVANYIDYDSRKLINDQMITSSSKNSSMIPKVSAFIWHAFSYNKKR